MRGCGPRDCWRTPDTVYRQLCKVLGSEPTLDVAGNSPRFDSLAIIRGGEFAKVNVLEASR